MNRYQKTKYNTALMHLSFYGSVFAFMLCAGGSAIASDQGKISVSVSQAKAQRGGTVDVSIQVNNDARGWGDPIHALVLKPSQGTETLTLHAVPGKAGAYRAAIYVKETAADGLYVIHAWTGGKTNPFAVGKSSFRIGNIIADFFVANYVDPQDPGGDVARYVKDFRTIGGNFIIAHNLIIDTKAFYASRIAKTDVRPGSAKDVVEQVLGHADREGLAVLLSVSWDRTRQSPYKDRMKEIKAIILEMYEIYRHHPSLAGFYSWQEGSGTYYAPFVREFSEYVKSFDNGLLTACAPHIDDPLLASYLSVIEELDILIYQSAVMGSYRTDNRKKYPLRRVRDFSGLGAGAKRLQNKITLTHVELFAYLEKRQHPDFVAASFEDIFGQILSAATVTDTDGISLFTHHAIIYEPLKKFDQVQKSRNALAAGLKAYELITSKVSNEPNRLALYVPYSDFVIERWNNYFLPALDAFRVLGIPIDILPYAPRLDESVYPYYPIHHNEDVLKRLVRERTVLVLANVSGFQQTDSDLIKAFVEQGGTVVAFGPQIPMGRTYERKDIFGIDESQATTRARVVVKDTIGERVSAGRAFIVGQTRLPAWTLTKGKVIATYEDNSPAITVNKYGKGTAITVLSSAITAARNMPELVRDVLQYAVMSAGNSVVVDVVGSDERTDVAIKKTQNGFRVAFVNHNPNELEILFRPVEQRSGPMSNWTDLVSGKRLQTTAKGSSLRLKIPGGGFRLLEFGVTLAR